MQKREQLAKPKRDRVVDEPQDNISIKTPDQSTALELDDILDEIDDVLEENAQAFVDGYIQKGGE